MDRLQHILPHCQRPNVSHYNFSHTSHLLNRCSNVVYFLIFLTVELAFGLVAASYLALADGYDGAGTSLKKAGGAFGFISGLLGYYTLGHLMCQEALFFSFPMGDTSRLFRRRLKKDV